MHKYSHIKLVKVPTKLILFALLLCGIALGITPAHAEGKCGNLTLEMNTEWNWHYPKETPNIKTGNALFKCPNGKKGYLYSIADGKREFFATNEKYQQIIPFKNTICDVLVEYCTGVSTGPDIEKEVVQVKSFNGEIDNQIPAGIYSRKKLLGLAHSKNGGSLLQAFKDIGWIKSRRTAPLDKLPQGKNYYLRTKLMGFSNNAKRISIAYNSIYKHSSDQVMIATWNLKNKNLLKLVVLAPRSRLLAVSPDNRWVATKEPVMKDGLITGKKLIIYDLQTGKQQRIQFNEKNELNIYEVSFSYDGRYIATNIGDVKWDDTVGEIERQLSSKELIIFDVETSKRVYESSRGYSHSKYVEVKFSPDNLKFLVKLIDQDKDEKEGRYEYQVGDMTTWKISNILEPFSSEIYEPGFSGDSKYLATSGKLYSIEQNKFIDDYNECKSQFGNLGIPIPGSNLNLNISNDEFEYRAVADSSCLTIGKDGLSFDTEEFSISKDLKKVAGLLKRGDETVFLSIQDINIPSEEMVAKAANKAVKKKKQVAENKKQEASDDAQIEEAEKMYKAGFPDEALALMNKFMKDKPANSRFNMLALNYIIDWAKDLPLADVGKAYLHEYERILAKPTIAQDGFMLGKKDVESGIIAKFVAPESVAEQAGMKAGDNIIKIDGAEIKDSDSYVELLETYQPGDIVTLSLLRDGEPMSVQLTLDEGIDGIVWAEFYLAKYGAIASAAGHPELTMQAAKKLKKLVHKYRSSANKTILGNFIRALETLSMAAKGDSDGAYKHALKNGGFVKEKDIILVFHFNSSRDAQFMAPLFQNRKKLAFLLGLEEDKLPATPTHAFPAQAYIDLDGNMVGKGKKSSKKKPGVQLLDD